MAWMVSTGHYLSRCAGSGRGYDVNHASCHGSGCRVEGLPLFAWESVTVGKTPLPPFPLPSSPKMCRGVTAHDPLLRRVGGGATHREQPVGSAFPNSIPANGVKCCALEGRLTAAKGRPWRQLRGGGWCVGREHVVGSRQRLTRRLRATASPLFSIACPGQAPRKIFRDGSQPNPGLDGNRGGEQANAGGKSGVTGPAHRVAALDRQ